MSQDTESRCRIDNVRSTLSLELKKVYDHYDIQLENLKRKNQTLTDTIANLTLRLRALELDIHPECPRCGQRLPEKPQPESYSFPPGVEVNIKQVETGRPRESTGLIR